MLTKKGKAIKDLHKDLLYLERKITSEISRLNKRAKSDFKRLLRINGIRSKLVFRSLKNNIFTKDWEPIVRVEYSWGFETYESFEKFCLIASEKIGIEFLPVDKSISVPKLISE